MQINFPHLRSLENQCVSNIHRHTQILPDERWNIKQHSLARKQQDWEVQGRSCDIRRDTISRRTHTVVFIASLES